MVETKFEFTLNLILNNYSFKHSLLYVSNCFCFSIFFFCFHVDVDWNYTHIWAHIQPWTYAWQSHVFTLIIISWGWSRLLNVYIEKASNQKSWSWISNFCRLMDAHWNKMKRFQNYGTFADQISVSIKWCFLV